MGLLTNPQTREKIVKIVSKYDNKLCVVCYIIGIAWFTALAYKPFNAATYFSENALLPGLVTSDFNHDYGAADYYNELKNELKSIKAQVENAPQNIKDDTLLYSLPSVWFEQKFRELGLDSYIQNYTFTYPAGILRDQKFSGRNVYGILRAPRAASTEAVVLSVPYRPPGSELDKTGSGIGLMLALAKAFRKHTYWAKDVIFLVTEHEQIGMQAWLNAYHYDTANTDLWPGELGGRSGSIQAAINLELGSDTISRINIKAEGLNGQLPNLDLINTLNRLCRREHVQPALQKRTDYWKPESREGFEHALKTMAQMMWHQASNSPTGNHGLFHRYHIEAITIQGVKIKNAKYSHGFVTMGRVVEGVFRSLNNLLERFHQSFFFYLLPATERYVSIGLYMPPFGIMVLPILIKALSLWIGYWAMCEEQQKKKEESKKEAESETEADEKEESENDGGDDKSENEPELSAMGLVPPLLMAALFGLGSYRSPWFFVETAHALRLKPQEGLALGAVAIHVAAVMFPRMLRRKASQKGNLSAAHWKLQKCIGLLSLGVVLGGLGVINISLATLIAVVWSPVVLVVRPTQRRLLNLAQYVLLVAISPLGFLFLASLVQNTVFERFTDSSELFVNAWATTQKALLSSVIDASLYSNWIYGLVTLVLFPLWLVFWSVLWASQDI